MQNPVAGSCAERGYHAWTWRFDHGPEQACDDCGIVRPTVRRRTDYGWGETRHYPFKPVAVVTLVVSIAVPEGAQISEDGELVLPDGRVVVVSTPEVTTYPEVGELIDAGVEVINIAEPTPRIGTRAYYA